MRNKVPRHSWKNPLVIIFTHLPFEKYEINHSLAPAELTWEMALLGTEKFLASSHHLGIYGKHCPRESIMTDDDQLWVLAVLALSATYTPELVAHFGSATSASSCFLQAAQRLVQSRGKDPEGATIRRCQAFFLLSNAEWAAGEPTSANGHLMVASRMGFEMGLHREETYEQWGNDRDHMERARTLFWTIVAQLNLRKGYKYCPRPFDVEVTTDLPGTTWNFTREGAGPSPTRAPLPGNTPAPDGPNRAIINLGVHIACAWCDVNVWRERASDRPLIDAFFRKLEEELKVFEDVLPAGFELSKNVEVVKIVLTLRQSQIGLRKPFLGQMIEASEIYPDERRGAHRIMCKVAEKMFVNVQKLYLQLKVFMEDQQLCTAESMSGGLQQTLDFCAYQCWTLSNTLADKPFLCWAVATKTETVPAARKMAEDSKMFLDRIRSIPG